MPITCLTWSTARYARAPRRDHADVAHRAARRGVGPLGWLVAAAGEHPRRSAAAAAPLRTALSPTSASRVYGHGPAAPGLTAHRVRVDYGRVRAVADVSVAFAAGRITALMGRGSGKSSLLWALRGSAHRRVPSACPTGDPRDLKPADRRRRWAGPQNATDLLYLESVAAEVPLRRRRLRHATGHTAALLETFAPASRPSATRATSRQASNSPLVLAVQLSAAPDALLLDEPTRGLTTYPAKAALTTTLRALAAQGHPVVVSTHDVEFVADCADEVVVPAEGELIAQARAPRWSPLHPRSPRNWPGPRPTPSISPSCSRLCPGGSR